MNATPGSRSCLYDEAELEALLDAMALQAAELLQGRRRVALIGILRRGAPLADRLSERLVRLHGLAQPLPDRAAPACRARPGRLDAAAGR
jgi:pyrimidine operon attenuation protein/uracil phosphoribosyltransferase